MARSKAIRYTFASPNAMAYAHPMHIDSVHNPAYMAIECVDQEGRRNVLLLNRKQAERIAKQISERIDKVGTTL